MQTNVAPIVTACREMSETKTGALIVIGQQSDLRLIAEGGIALDAKVSTSLLKNIFFKNAPLHDGAVLIEGDRIVAAQGGEIRLDIDPVRLQQTLQRYLTINTRKRSKKEVAE